MYELIKIKPYKKPENFPRNFPSYEQEIREYKAESLRARERKLTECQIGKVLQQAVETRERRRSEGLEG